MTSPPSNSRSPISDELLLEMLFRADKLINDKATMGFAIGDVWISSSTHSLNVFVNNRDAYCYWKPEDGMEGVSRSNIRARSEWAPTAFREALKILRESMVLDDLSQIH